MLLLLDALALLRLLFLPFLLPATAECLAVVCLVPLTERVGVDLYNGCFGQGVGADELVIRRVEGDGDDTDFTSDALAAPSKVAGVET